MVALPEWLADKIIPLVETGCWVTEYAPSGCGYVYVRVPGQGRTKVRLHGLVYRLLVGEVPAGLVLDHTCRVKVCCNPAHQEPVTSRINTLRGDTLAARQVARTHCPQDHPYDEANTYTDKKRRRHCRACMRARG